MSCAVAAPAAFYRDEDFGHFFYEGGLLFWRDHDVAVALFCGSEGSEDSVAYAEVGAAHVGGFLGAFKTESGAAEIVNVHGGSRSVSCVFYDVEE